MTEAKDEVHGLAICLAVPEVHVNVITQFWKWKIDFNFNSFL